jgi:UPF0176 protein
MKVKLKKEIVTLGVPGVSPTKLVGKYIKPQDWNAIISEVGLLPSKLEYVSVIIGFEVIIFI